MWVSSVKEKRENQNGNVLSAMDVNISKKHGGLVLFVGDAFVNHLTNRTQLHPKVIGLPARSGSLK